MTAAAPISFARGAPSLDIVDVEGLREAADRAFQSDPAGTFSYGTAAGYIPLRDWIAERQQLPPDQVITFSELNRYVGDRVKELTGNRQHPVLHSIQPSRDLPLAVVRR